MYLDRYDLNAGDSLTTFYFVSEGNRGRFIKIIQFEPMELEGVYNLAFGDHDAATGQLNDKAVTDNGDTEKTLATVVAALYKFADHYPAAWVYATGSTATRTRLYRMGINKYWPVVAADFDILGQRDSEWEPYEVGKDYQAFAVRRKASYI
ncbi:MAG: hypothetical protein EOO37_02385 [Cytophagaceae bacterium]|nr:MAG: hypothetical protein EOO37_02385 [Cytophagaceae bacterium]